MVKGGCPIHLINCVEVLRTGKILIILITSPCSGVCRAEERILAGIAELIGQALEGVVARSVKLHGLCLLLGVSIAALRGSLYHMVLEAVHPVPAVVPPLSGVVAVGEVLDNRGHDDGVERSCDLFVTRVALCGDEVHSTKDTVSHRILWVPWVGIVDCNAHLTDRRALAIRGLPLFHTPLPLGRSKDASHNRSPIARARARASLSKVGALLVGIHCLLMERRTSNAHHRSCLRIQAPIRTGLLSQRKGQERGEGE